MYELQEYFLQKSTEHGWEEITKSYDRDTLIYAGILRRDMNEICRVIDKNGNVIWHAKSASIKEAPTGTNVMD